MRLLESSRHYSGAITRVCENDGCMGEIESASEAARQQMENLLRGEISHDFIQNLDEVLSRFLCFTKTLKLSLRLAER
jgi:hypothetical protein